MPIPDPTGRHILHTLARRRGQVADMIPPAKWGAPDARKRGMRFDDAEVGRGE